MNLMQQHIEPLTAAAKGVWQAAHTRGGGARRSRAELAADEKKR